MAVSLRQRFATTTCAKCRKTFAPGDRVMTAFIVHAIGRNPENKELGAMLGEEFELVHVACIDPGLNSSLLLT